VPDWKSEIGRRLQNLRLEPAREGMILVACGIGLGVVGALGLTRVISTLLFGVRPTDLMTFVAVVAALGGVGLLACVIPARRATKVAPMEALRRE
jgi:putative ABC transport system permease protein